ncbi:MAG: hypothetical protein QM775_34200 [Pirellulales bacterium]
MGGGFDILPTRSVDPNTRDFTISVVGDVGPEVNPTNPERTVVMRSGAVRLWSRDGFDSIPQMFRDPNELTLFLRRVWPQTVVAPRPQIVSALYFGARSLQIEVLQRDRDHRKLRLQFTSVIRQDGASVAYRLWKVVSCDDAPDSRMSKRSFERNWIE